MYDKFCVRETLQKSTVKKRTYIQPNVLYFYQTYHKHMMSQ